MTYVILYFAVCLPFWVIAYALCRAAKDDDDDCDDVDGG
jgi:hypothetical protein